MSAVPKFIPEPAEEAGVLLDDFIRYRRCRPRGARVVRVRDELPWILRGYVHPAEVRCAWRAWTQRTRTCLLTAEVAQAESRFTAATVLDVRFFDPEGMPFPPALWQRLPDGTWLPFDRQARGAAMSPTPH